MKNDSNLQQQIDLLDSFVKKPSEGLPEEVFLWVTSITPMINVDLLIKNDKNETLLTWRDDTYYPAGWHIPGGIIRYKETISDRIHAVAESELAAKIEFNEQLLAINQVIHPSRRDRGHFISLLFKCMLVSSLDEMRRWVDGIPCAGEWAWHHSCPDNILSVHEMYREMINS